ncbi:helix-turn-helix transcriptional regulator [Paenibacillus sp. ClWae2A]|uniref:helix-turn-helix domain-containing protein n=1 Tax=Paenibacillus sp. ClWae2A TaxID=3057177 RepID=UPI0028F599CF|nr:helix-turn-helix transcriptional regulator [Paenibacillus sp. ClWae2A]MDT9720497.1 helix-turn-helix transcriptional regulator [Paenibacillus sp. ClWae2A]
MFTPFSPRAIICLESPLYTRRITKVVKVSRGRCRLKILLKERRMKQSDLVKLTGYSRHLISNWANNQDKMSADAMLTIAYALGCRVEDLYDLIYH